MASVAYVSQAVVHEVADQFVDDAVKRETAYVSAGDEIQPAQYGELLARRRDGQSEGSRQIADAEFLVRQRVHDGDPHRVREGLEDFGRVPKNFRCGQARFRVGDPFRIDYRGKARRFVDFHTL